MEKQKKILLKKAFSVLFKGDVEEIVERKISDFGSGAHIIMPKKHKGKNAKIVIYR